MKPDDPAFPVGQLLLPGLTKREYAAIAAMQGISSAIFAEHSKTLLHAMEKKSGKPSEEIIAIICRKFADALLAELAK